MAPILADGASPEVIPAVHLGAEPNEAAACSIIWTTAILPKVFISYRREDTPGHAGRLYDRLQQEFGPDNVFIDVDTLLPGDDFVAAIGDTLNKCDLMIALIGPRWLTATDDRGQPRLDDQSDFVRIEIQTALERRIRTVPVLVERASMPLEQQLPEPLRPLVRRQAIELTDTRWASDVGALLEKVKRTAAAGPAAPPGNPIHAQPAHDERRKHWGIWPGVSALVLAAFAILSILLVRSNRGQVIRSNGEQNASHSATPVVASAVRGSRQDVPGDSTALRVPTAGRAASNRGQQQVNPNPKRPEKACPENDTDASRCISACDDGDASSCTDLGLMYAAGRGGLTKDAARAVTLFQRACDAGNMRGCTNLGLSYETGQGGLPKNEVRAMALHQRACDGGDMRGCTNLGLFYETGRGGAPKSAVRAMALHQRACDAGDGLGCLRLAVMYRTGRSGLPQDEARAVALFQRACDAGNARGCANLPPSRRPR
jgi:hypothetical protein